MITYELAKSLKDAGFPQLSDGGYVYKDGTIDKDMISENYCYKPSLSELIEACGIKMNKLTQNEMNNNSIVWTAVNWEGSIMGEGSTPEEAVANLWLALNKK